VVKTAEGKRPVGEDRLRRLGLRRSGPALQHDDERLAHLPGGRRIRASNPCSEYMFLDDTACNLASINLLPYACETATFDVAAYEHTAGCGRSCSRSR
jgi:hypothetical protein